MMKVISAVFIFGADPIPFEDITHLQKNSPDLIIYALPAVVFITLLEIFGSWILDRKNYEAKETIGSVLVGIGNLFINLLLKIALFYGAVWIYNLIPWRMEFNWWMLIPCFILYDLCSYWSHRISHFHRFFWATHVVHHSGEHFNLTVSFRQSWVQHFKLIFFLPISLLGFHPVVFFIASQLSVLYQFWVHTEAIKKLHPIIEYVFVTPSHHRVHHGKQDQYLDMNFAATFIIWDRLFGTFVEEDEKPDYGLTTGIKNKINPFYLNFHEYYDMIEDVKNARGLRKKLHYLFGRPSEIAREKKQKL
ncbi:MAG TPA: sterol desaturase family protein [Sphingobacteriaceae bacterium]